MIGHLINRAIDEIHHASKDSKGLDFHYSQFLRHSGNICKEENIDPYKVYRIAYNIVYDFEEAIVSETMSAMQEAYGYDITENENYKYLYGDILKRIRGKI